MILLVSCLWTPILNWAQLADQPNPIQNPSFEEPEPNDPGKPAAHWNAWGAGWERVEDWAPILDGKAMLAYKHWEMTSADTSGIWQDLPGIQKGQTVKVEVSFYPDAPDAGNPPTFIDLRFEIPYEGQQVTVDHKRIHSTDWKMNQWNTISLKVTAPSDAMRFLLIVAPAEQSPGGAVKFDRIRFAIQN
jgi:hypothetical protein